MKSFVDSNACLSVFTALFFAHWSKIKTLSFPKQKIEIMSINNTS